MLRVGRGVNRWKAGDEVVAHCPSVELALVEGNQLVPEPAHLSWEEAASPGLVSSTADRRPPARQQERRRHEDLWMNLEEILSSHFADYEEAREANRLVDRGLIHPLGAPGPGGAAGAVRPVGRVARRVARDDGDACDPTPCER